MLSFVATFHTLPQTKGVILLLTLRTQTYVSLALAKYLALILSWISSLWPWSMDRVHGLALSMRKPGNTPTMSLLKQKKQNATNTKLTMLLLDLGLLLLLAPVLVDLDHQPCDYSWPWPPWNFDTMMHTGPALVWIRWLTHLHALSSERSVFAKAPLVLDLLSPKQRSSASSLRLRYPFNPPYFEFPWG
jgi:hypothetical protein